MIKKKILVLPFASTSIISGPTLATNASDLLLTMSFDDDGQKRSINLRFVKQRAFRKRSESYCTEWHVTGVFDTVCEIQDSDWIDELNSAPANQNRGKWIMRHFMIYVDSFGCLEVVAESVAID